jgi:hypothetical protein
MPAGYPFRKLSVERHDIWKSEGKLGAMAEPERTASEKLVNCVALTLFARLAMVAATTLILPVGLWMAQRGVSTIDEISKKIDLMKESALEQGGEIRALRMQSTAQQQILADHETRVRELERASRNSQLIARP